MLFDNLVSLAIEIRFFIDLGQVVFNSHERLAYPIGCVWK